MRIVFDLEDAANCLVVCDKTLKGQIDLPLNEDVSMFRLGCALRKACRLELSKIEPIGVRKEFLAKFDLRFPAKVAGVKKGE